MNKTEDRMNPEVPPRSPGGSAGHCYKIGGWYVKYVDTVHHGEFIRHMIGGWYVKASTRGVMRNHLPPKRTQPHLVLLGFRKPKVTLRGGWGGWGG